MHKSQSILAYIYLIQEPKDLVFFFFWSTKDLVSMPWPWLYICTTFIPETHLHIYLICQTCTGKTSMSYFIVLVTLSLRKIIFPLATFVDSLQPLQIFFWLVWNYKKKRKWKKKEERKESYLRRVNRDVTFWLIMWWNSEVCFTGPCK